MVIRIRSEIALGWGLTGKGHKGAVWSDDNVLSWVRHMSSPLRLLFKSNRLISCPQTPSLLFRLMLSPLPGKRLLSQSLQAQRLSIPQELVKTLSSPRSLPRSPSTWQHLLFPSSIDPVVWIPPPHLSFGPKYSVLFFSSWLYPCFTFLAIL